MTLQSKKLGNQAESLAAKLLTKKKFQILRQNLRTKFGEVDILAKDGRTIVVVEVKAKSSGRFGSAIEMITQAKQRKLVLLAMSMQQKFKTNNIRIDIVTVDNAATEPVLRHQKGIVEVNA